jgi:hypothetical protein
VKVHGVLLEGETCAGLAALLVRFVPPAAVPPHLRSAVAEIVAHGRIWSAENGWQAGLVPYEDVARALGISRPALRRRLNRGTWDGEERHGHWYAVPPHSPAGE